MTVTLRPLTADAWPDWLDRKITEYVGTLVERLGLDPAAARAASERQCRQLLPDGLETPRMHLDVVVDGSGERVGSLWWGPHPRRTDAAFVYDLVVDAAHRGAGYGRAAMEAFAAAARADGYAAAGLSVTASNEVARRLYRSLGYGEQSVEMLRDL